MADDFVTRQEFQNAITLINENVSDGFKSIRKELHEAKRESTVPWLSILALIVSIVVPGMLVFGAIGSKFVSLSIQPNTDNIIYVDNKLQENKSIDIAIMERLHLLEVEQSAQHGSVLSNLKSNIGL